MGFARFVTSKSISYLTALVATVSILYVGLYPSIQKVILASANSATSTFEKALLSTNHGLTQQQITASVAAYKASYLSAYGFNQPLPVKFLVQLSNLFQFQFGVSFFLHAPNGSNVVSEIIIAYLPNTILLFTTGTLIVIFVGAIIGLLAARRIGGKLDKVIPFVAVIHSSLPSWWIGFLLIAYFSYTLNILPTGGITSVPPPTGVLPHFLDLLAHMALPLTAFFIANVGGFAYVIRSLVVSTMGEDFIMTAKARGISDGKILFSHVLRTVSPSIATQSVLAVAGSFGGGLITEVVFRWPGLGLLTYEAIVATDLPIIMATTFVLTLILFLGLYIGELAYGVLDPRIRAGE